MKRNVLFVLSVIALSTSPSAQAPADAVATPLLGLPANLREGATVIKWKPDQTYDTLQKGTNGLVCYDRSGLPEQQPFSVECSSVTNLDREAQNLKAEALGDRTKRPERMPSPVTAGAAVTQRDERGDFVDAHLEMFRHSTRRRACSVGSP